MADIYNILAGKGRGEDKYIRNVGGEPSHVNEVEKDAIDIYGLLGEMFTKKVGSGDTNPNTGLPEYDWVKTLVGSKVKNNPHNKRHWKKKETWPGWHEGLSKQESIIREQQQQTIEAGQELLDPTTEENIDPETGLPLTAGELNLGQESLTMEQYQGMTPQEIVDDIFAKQYNSQVPPEMAAKGMTIEKFKAELAARLKNMPQFKEADPEELKFLEEGKDIAIEKASTKAQEGAQQVGGAMMSAYGGMGTGVRAGVGAGSKLASTYGLDLATADLGYRKDKYGLGEEAAGAWESEYGDFLGTLPAAA